MRQSYRDKQNRRARIAKEREEKSVNKKNNIAKSIALVLALVLAFSCILTACADKTARQDVEDLKATVDALNKDVETVEGRTFGEKDFCADER